MFNESIYYGKKEILEILYCEEDQDILNVYVHTYDLKNKKYKFVYLFNKEVVVVSFKDDNLIITRYPINNKLIPIKLQYKARFDTSFKRLNIINIRDFEFLDSNDIFKLLCTDLKPNLNQPHPECDKYYSLLKDTYKKQFNL